LARFGFGTAYNRDDLYAIYRVCLDVGLNFVDTSDTYGKGLSEELLGEFHRKDRRPVTIATKFTQAKPYDPNRNFSVKAVNTVLERSLKRLQVDTVDLYQERRRLGLDDDCEGAHATLADRSNHSAVSGSVEHSTDRLARQLRNHLLGASRLSRLRRIQRRPQQALRRGASRTRERGHHGLDDVPVHHGHRVHRITPRRNRVRCGVRVHDA
jgi:aldo/keto reductase family protein